MFTNGLSQLRPQKYLICSIIRAVLCRGLSQAPGKLNGEKQIVLLCAFWTKEI